MNRCVALYFDEKCFAEFISFSPQNEQEEELRHLFNNLLRNNISILFGFERAKLNIFHQTYKGNLVLNTLVMNYPKNGIKTIFSVNYLQTLDIDKENPHIVFFVDKTDKECEQLENKFGFIFFNFSLFIKKGIKLFSSHIFNVTKQKDTEIKNKLVNWNNLNDLRLPCNSLVVVDNYILDKEDDFKNNLVPLIDILLPQKLHSTQNKFDIIIITQNKENKDYQKRIDAIENSIKRPFLLNISVIILLKKEDNHDRNIFTNYQWFHSGHSFSYFGDKGNVKKTTSLFYYPIWHLQKGLNTTKLELDKTAFWSICALLQEAKEIVDTSENLTTSTVLSFWGNKQNRLLQHGI